MGKSPVATRRRRGRGTTVRTAPMFPAQRRAAREQAAKISGRIANKVPGVTAKPARRRLPRPVVWALWLLGAAAASVLIGFALGLARPRTRPEGQI